MHRCVCVSQDFRKANLSGATFENAFMNGTLFHGANLTGCKFGITSYLEFDEPVRAILFPPNDQRLDILIVVEGHAGTRMMCFIDYPSEVHVQERRETIAERQELIAFSLDGKYCAAGNYRRVNVYLGMTESKATTIVTPAVATSLAVSIERTVAVGYATGMIELWDVEKGIKAVTLEGHTNAITSMAFT